MPSTSYSVLKIPDAGTVANLNLRKLLPQPVKLAYRIAKRQLRDLQTGALFKIAKPSDVSEPMLFAIELTQPIIANVWLENKKHNFRQAAQQVNAVTLQPGRVFSFWKTVGNPTANKGYKTGRNLVNGQVSETYGGGLCQLSGILYHTSLLAGLAIVERHNHSVDLYANGETRFTPLGADATVAFGYKDLRVANPFGFAVRFEVEVGAEKLVCRLRSEEPINAQFIEFQAVESLSVTKVVTKRQLMDGRFEEIGRSVYETKLVIQY